MRVEVQQGLAREVTLAVPPGVVVNQVNGATVADWESQAENAARAAARSGRDRSCRSSCWAKAGCRADGDVTVPLVRVPAAERETGGVAVSVLGAGEIEKHQMRGLEPADVSELADVSGGRESPSMVAFRLRPIAGGEHARCRSRSSATRRKRC